MGYNRKWTSTSTGDAPPIWVPMQEDKDKPTCLHLLCPECKGTGQRRDGLGLCVHMISCPCTRCTPRW